MTRNELVLCTLYVMPPLAHEEMVHWLDSLTASVESSNGTSGEEACMYFLYDPSEATSPPYCAYCDLPEKPYMNARAAEPPQIRAPEERTFDHHRNRTDAAIEG